jgi:hypothetical protein
MTSAGSMPEHPLPRPRRKWPCPRPRPAGALRLAACAISGLMLLGAAAPAAAAKSGLWVDAVVTAAERASRPAGVVVSASGGDDAAGRQRLCLQRLVDGSWHTLACGRVGLGTGGRVRVLVPGASFGDRFRAQVRKVGPGRRTAVDLTSPVVSASASAPASATSASAPASAARAHRQTNSRSAVSFRSVDSGTETASVVRPK